MRVINYSMFKDIIDNHFDPHKQALMMKEFVADEITFAFTQECKHKPSHIVQAQATGDMAYKANGSFCRACGHRVKPIVQIIGWQLEDQIPTAPGAA